MSMTYFENIKSYVGFAETDQQALGQLADSAETSYAGFAEHFYECISRHPDAHKVLDGAEQIARLKNSLVRWMRSGLRGPHDETFFERRCRIGRVHVRIGLPQQYMFTAMNVLRLDFHHLIRRTYSGDIERERSAHDAVDKLFDLELAIMLHTYRDDSEERMRRAERLATIGQIAASIGHDLRNPLSVIQSSMYILRKRTNDDPRSARHIDRIDTQVEICGSIISNLMELARSNPPRAELIDFTAIFDQVRASLQIPTSVAVDMQTTEDTTLYADAALLRQALVNLVSNAIQAHGDSPGRIWVTLARTADQVIIEVADDGPGFDAETITRAFEPLVTTRTTGTGLGLALVKGVTERHGGVVEAANRPEGGAIVRMILPLSLEDVHKKGQE